MNKKRYTTKRNLRWLVLVVMGLVYLGIGHTALAQQEFPTRPVVLVIPYGAGGATSMGARILSGPLAEYLGQPVVSDNRPGAGGAIAANFVAKSKPDGYTLLIATSASNGISLVIRKLPYANEDFEFLGQWGGSIMGLTVKADAPWKTLQEFVEDAKKNPGKIKYATSGVGTSGEFGMELFKLSAGVKMDPLRFPGSAQMDAAIMGGHAHAIFNYEMAFKPLVQGGRYRVLAMAIEERAKDYPEVPTFAELGYPKVKIDAWYGIAGPKGLPKEVSGKLEDAIRKTCQNVEVQTMIYKLGFTPTYRNAEELTKDVYEREKLYRWIAKEGGIKAE